MKYYPHSQLQIFVDREIATDPKISKILETMNARVYIFDCPNYKEDDHHTGLFPTMIRFYPIFDINTHPLKIAHIQELEPETDFINRFTDLEKASRSSLIERHNCALIYGARNFYETFDWKNKSTFDEGISYPWCIAGRFIMFQKIPFELWTTFLKKVDSGKSFINKYAIEQNQKIKNQHGKYHFGVDEAFLNDTMIPWLIQNNYGIGIVTEYNISHSVYYLRDKITGNSKSKEIMNYIMQKDQSIQENLKEFDSMFYKKSQSTSANDIAMRFYEVVEKMPSWLGKDNSSLLTKVFQGYTVRNCMIITRNKQIVAVQDIK